jgi:hypothetical protein
MQHKCDNCDTLWDETSLVPVEHLTERVDPGGIMPSGQCPECHALCYPCDERESKVSPLPMTVVGFHQDTSQRFCSNYAAFTPEEAEAKALEEHIDLVICATFAGSLSPLDDETYVATNY